MTNTNSRRVKLSVLEAADHLGICERTMRSLVADDEVTYYRTGGKKKGKLFFYTEDLDARLQPAGGPGARKGGSL